MSIFNKFKKDEKEGADKKSVKIDNVVKEEKNVVTEKAEKKEKPVVAEKEIKKVEKEEHKADKNVSLGKKNLTGILIKPLITEKATNLGQLSQYVFEVATRSNKIQIALAIESRYGVKPIKVNIIKNSGRSVRYGKSTGKTKATKKAVVFLPEGKSIKVHEGV